MQAGQGTAGTRSKTVNRYGLAALSLALVVSWAGNAWAQSSTPSEKQPAIDKADPAPILIPTSDLIDVEAVAKLLNGSVVKTTAEPCFPVKTIEISGDHSPVAQELIVAAIKPQAKPCQGNTSVGELIKAINGLYAEHGFVTTQAWIPEQDIAKTGILKLNIVPGRIDKIVYTEEREPWQWFVPRMVGRTTALFEAKGPGDFIKRVGNWWSSLDDGLDRFTLLPPSARIWMASTIKEGDILQVDALQGTLDALNRVPSHDAKADLDPGSKPATSQVTIKNRIDDSFRVYAGYDNKSSSGIDRLRFGTTIEKDNLIGINDSWSTTLRSDIDSNELSGNVSIPFGNLVFRAAADWSESTIEPLPLVEYFTTTWNVSGGFDWTVMASKTQRAVLDMTLKHREQDRYVNGVELLGNQRVTALAAGATYSRFYERGSITGRLGFEAGLPIFNANRDPDDIDAFTPKSQFFKLEGAASASYVIPQIASFSSALNGQWSDDVLFADDQITIGSVETVRGYSKGFMQADSGFVWRNEIAFAVSAGSILPGKTANAEWGRTVLSRVNPYVFLDGGLGRDNANDITGYRLSTGLGVRYGGPALSYDVGYAFRLAEDDDTNVDDATGELFVNLRLKLF